MKKFISSGFFMFITLIIAWFAIPITLMSDLWPEKVVQTQWFWLLLLHILVSVAALYVGWLHKHLWVSTESNPLTGMSEYIPNPKKGYVLFVILFLIGIGLFVWSTSGYISAFPVHK